MIEVVILIIVLAVIAAVVLIPKGAAVDNVVSIQPSGDTLQLMTVPDSPLAFGYKCMWFAVKTDDKDGVAEALGFKSTMACNWEYGIAQAYGKSVYITPAIGTWTLAVGWGLPHGDSKESIEKVKSLADKLSERFGEAQFFGTHRVVEYHCWLKSVGGKTERLYSYSGESGENLAVEGGPTVFEKQYNLVNTLAAEAQSEGHYDREDLDYPDEEMVMKLAGAWSINPQLIENNDNIKGLGLVGTLK